MQIQSYTNKSGKSFASFTSVHQDNQSAAVELQNRIASGAQTSDFALTVMDAWEKAVAKRTTMSGVMVYWLHKLSQPEKKGEGAAT